jgi:hypothetical protein
LQLLLGLFAEGAFGVIVDQLREVDARLVAVLLDLERGRLAALLARQAQVAHAGDVERLVRLREVRVAGDDLFGALVRGDVGLLQLEVVLRHLQVLLRVGLQRGVAQDGRVGLDARAGLVLLLLRPRPAAQNGQRQTES